MVQHQRDSYISTFSEFLLFLSATLAASASALKRNTGGKNFFIVLEKLINLP